MEHTRLGLSGLTVSRIGLGCMSYGQAATGLHQWTLDEDAAAPFFQQAVELGVTFWDTANGYRPRHQAVLPAGGHRGGHQGLGQDARRTRWQRTVP